jgi:hypothetical protein
MYVTLNPSSQGFHSVQKQRQDRAREAGEAYDDDDIVAPLLEEGFFVPTAPSGTTNSNISRLKERLMCEAYSDLRVRQHYTGDDKVVGQTLQSNNRRNSGDTSKDHGNVVSVELGRFVLSMYVFICMYLCICVSFHVSCIYLSMYLCIYMCLCIHRNPLIHYSSAKSDCWIHVFMYLYPNIYDRRASKRCTTWSAVRGGFRVMVL